MNLRFPILLASMLAFIPFSAKACMWDSDSLAEEKKKSPKLAEVILGPAPKPADPVPLRARIQKLKAEPRENDPAWWNDLAGAHLRLGQPAEAVKLLEPVMAIFPNDYGMHANLGTAYHLLGRYKDAEREIARDLELNPEGHFGLEKYHLALLQYLVRDAEYQKEHVYVDEFSADFFESAEWTDLSLMPNNFRFAGLDSTPGVPGYRAKWNLASDTNLMEGVIYMASLNPKEPACFVMLGISTLAQGDYARDLHLASAAFERAIKLGSPQVDILKSRIGFIQDHIRQAGGGSHAGGIDWPATVLLVLGLFASVLLFLRWRRRSAKAG